jgi:hypothetical protein
MSDVALPVLHFPSPLHRNIRDVAYMQSMLKIVLCSCLNLSNNPSCKYAIFWGRGISVFRFDLI